MASSIDCEVNVLRLTGGASSLGGVRRTIRWPSSPRGYVISSGRSIQNRVGNSPITKQSNRLLKLTDSPLAMARSCLMQLLASGANWVER